MTTVHLSLCGHQNHEWKKMAQDLVYQRRLRVKSEDGDAVDSPVFNLRPTTGGL